MSDDTPKRLSYDPKDAPKPINDHDWYVMAVLIELRLIRMALQDVVVNMMRLSSQPPMVEEKKAPAGSVSTKK